MSYEERCKELEDYSKLKDGWDTYDTPAPDAISIQKAKIELDKLHDLSILNVTNNLPNKILPMADGGVYFIFETSYKKYLYMEFSNVGV